MRLTDIRRHVSPGRKSPPDCPAAAGGRAYLIERELEQDGYVALKALVADYLAQAEGLGDVPMAGSPLDRYLEHLQ